MASIYNQSVNLAAQGRFAPGVNYRADIRKPAQPIQDLPDVKASFNIDLSGIGDAIAEVGSNRLKMDLEAIKQKRANADKVAKATFLNGIASELMKNETAAEQNMYDKTTLDLMQRSVLDRGLAEGGALGVSANEIYALAPNYGPTAMQTTKDRLDWYANEREENQTLANEFVKSVPAAAQLSHDQQIYAARTAQQAANAYSAASQRYNGDPSEANKIMFLSEAENMGNIQTKTVLNNYLNSVADGAMSPSEAKLQVHNSLLNTFSNLDPSMSLYLTELIEKKNAPLIELAGNITKEEAEVVKNTEATFKAGIKANQLAEHPELLSEYAFGGDVALHASLIGESPVKLDQPIVKEGYTIQSGGYTIGVPQLSTELYTGGTDPIGRHWDFNEALTKKEAQYALTHTTKFMQLFNNTKMPKNTPNMTRRAAQSVMLASYANNVVNKDFDKLSPSDQKIALNNTKTLNNTTGDIYVSNLEQGGETEAIAQIKQNRTNEAGATIIQEYSLDTNTDLMMEFDKINQSKILIEGLRISKQGDLLLQDDLPGLISTSAQLGSGYEFKETLQKINSTFTNLGLTSEQKRAVIETKLGRPVEDWDGSAGYSTKPTLAEESAHLIKVGANKAWSSVQHFFTDKENLNKATDVTSQYVGALGNFLNNLVPEKEGVKNSLPEWEERFNQMSTEFKEDFRNLSEDAQSALKEKYNTYRAVITGSKASMKQVEEVTSEMLGVENKDTFAEVTEKKVEEGVPVQVAAVSAAYETMPKEKKKKLIKLVSKATYTEEEKTQAGIEGFLEGVEVAGKGLASPFEPFGAIYAGVTNYARNGNVSATLDVVGNMPGGFFNQVLTAAAIGAYDFSKGLETVTKLVLSALFDPDYKWNLKIPETSEVEPLISIDSDEYEAELLKKELTSKGVLLLGTETLEDLRRMK